MLDIKFRRLLVVIMALLLVFVLAACGSDDPDETTTEETDTTETTVEEDTSTDEEMAEGSIAVLLPDSASSARCRNWAICVVCALTPGSRSTAACSVYFSSVTS